MLYFVILNGNICFCRFLPLFTSRLLNCHAYTVSSDFNYDDNVYVKINLLNIDTAQVDALKSKGTI